MEVTILEFVCCALAIFYATIAVIFIYQFYKLISKKIKFKVTVAFYLAILLAVIARTVNFFILYMKGNSIGSKIVYFIVIFPDLINICVYLFLTWNFFTYYAYCHINLANDNTIFNPTHSDMPILSAKTNIALYIITSVYLVFFTTLAFLTIYNCIPELFLPIISSIFNIVTPIIAISFFFYLLFKYSGSPFKNEKLRKQIYKSFIICIIWTVSRLITGIAGLIKGRFYIDEAIKELNNKEEEVIVLGISIIGYFGITEVIPILVSLDSNIINFYVVTSTTAFKKRLIEILIEKIDKDPESHELNSEVKNSISSDKNNRKSENSKDFKTRLSDASECNYVVIKQEFIIKFKDFKVLSVMFPKRKSSLGEIYKGNLKSLDVSIRMIEFDRLSRYDLEAFNKDMDELLYLNNPFISKVIAFCFEKIPKIYILYTLYPTSLNEFLHTTKSSIRKQTIKDNDSQTNISNFKNKEEVNTENEDCIFSNHRSNFNKLNKFQLCFKIAMGLKYLHDQKLPHMHLSSKNILLDKRLNPKITDYGMLNIKELASIFLNYKNKNAYSAPEVLEINKTICNDYFSSVEKSLIYKYTIHHTKGIKNKESNLKHLIKLASEQQSNINNDNRYSKFVDNNNNQSLDNSLDLLISNKQNSLEPSNKKSDLNQENSSSQKASSFESCQEIFQKIINEKNENNITIDDKNPKTKLKNLLLVEEELYSIVLKADIYSLGIIFWEIFSENKPFNTSLKEIFKIVVEDKLRPEISKDLIPEKMALLIKKCWLQDYKARLNINEVIENLKEIEKEFTS